MHDRPDLRDNESAETAASGIDAFRDELFGRQASSQPQELLAAGYSRNSVYGGPGGFSADRERMSGSVMYGPSYQRDSIYLPPDYFAPSYDNYGGNSNYDNYGGRYGDNYGSYSNYDNYGGRYGDNYGSYSNYDNYGGRYGNSYGSYDNSGGYGNYNNYGNYGDYYEPDYYRNSGYDPGRDNYYGRGNDFRYGYGQNNSDYFYGNSYDPQWDGGVTHYNDGYVVDRSWSGRGYRFYGREDYDTGVGAYLTGDSRRDSVRGGRNGYSADREGSNGGYNSRPAMPYYGGGDMYSYQGQPGGRYGYSQGGNYNQGGSYDRDGVRGGRDGYSADRERYRGSGSGRGGYNGGYAGGGPNQVFDFALRGFDSWAGYDIARRYARNGQR